MSIRIMTKIWDYGPDSRGKLLILLALADFANDAGECWPSIATIARKARMTERGVQKIIRELEAENWLVTIPGNGRCGTNRYRVTPNIVHPEYSSPPPNAEAETPNAEAENPERSSPKPSRTVKEPPSTEERGFSDEVMRLVMENVKDAKL